MNKEIFEGKTLLITGGTGSFGNTVLKHFPDGSTHVRYSSFKLLTYSCSSGVNSSNEGILDEILLTIFVL